MVSPGLAPVALYEPREGTTATDDTVAALPTLVPGLLLLMT